MNGKNTVEWKDLKKMYCPFCGSVYVKKEIPDMSQYVCLICEWITDQQIHLIEIREV